MELEGRIIANRYELLKKIGNGGMATVYKAKDMVLKRFVAIKILRDEFTTDQEFIRRFNIEAQAAASLAHPNIVSIYDVGTEDNIYYIVMELIQGKTLKQIIDEDGVLPWKWSLNIAIQIASALETAHKNNIIHRDIKPHNIIITEDGIAKVTDFGIAKAVSNSTITAFGTTIGSVHYFSPEHAKGGFTDAKSDIYSLGIVMYEMLTGRVPFDADTPVSIALKHMQEEPVEPIKLNPTIPYSVNKIILKAIKKDSSLRYQNATDMLKDLGMALKNPDGNFVQDTRNTAYTQVVPTLSDEEIKIENIKSKTANSNAEGKDAQKEKKVSFFAKHPAMKVLLIILIIILIPVAGFFGAKGILNIGREKDVDLPNFVAMTRQEAQTTAQKLNLELQIEERYDKEVELDKVISQEPGYMENYKIKEHSTVKLVISKGTSVKNVPKVVGETYEDAVSLIEQNELIVEKIEESSDKVEAGYVIKQEPAEGSELNAGDSVKVYVSTGIKQITMEYVIGQNEQDAKKTLGDLGFEVVIVYEEDTSKDDGTVLKQSIDTGETVNSGTKVTLTVNKIEKLKEGTVNINLMSLLGGTTSPDYYGTETVQVEIKVNEETVYKESHSRDTEQISQVITGKGTVTIKVFVDGVRKAQKTLNLNSENPVLNID